MNLIEKELILSEQILKEELYKQNNYISSDVNDFTFSKSKKIRSKILFLFANALNYKKQDEIIYLSCATELIHNATLIHDDVIDNSSMRRGKKSLNSKFDNHISILSGDLLLSFAINFLSKCNDINIFSAFADSLKLICEGEINQHFNKNKILPLKEYILKSEHKTAELFKAPLLSLSIIENCSEYKSQLSNFAKYYGTAFQIKDDLLNVLNTDLSKPAFCDICNGTYTAPIIYLSEKFDLKNKTEKEIITLIQNEPECIEKTKKLINSFVDNAITSINSLPKSAYKQKLIDITLDLKNI